MKHCYTWCSLVDKHTQKNEGMILFDGHIQVMTLDITSAMFEKLPKKEQDFLRRQPKGCVIRRSDIDIPIVNTEGEPR